jgi:hypothetical protein
MICIQMVLFSSLLTKFYIKNIMEYLLNTNNDFCAYSEFFLRLAIGFYMLIFQPPVNFYFCENYKAYRCF